MNRLVGLLVCRFRGHADYGCASMLPEHGYGLYAFSALYCGRCGGQMATGDPRQVGPCGACPEGACDGCEACREDGLADLDRSLAEARAAFRPEAVA